MSSWKYLLFDIECNGFKPDKIWVVCIMDLLSGQRKSFVGMDEIANALLLLNEASMLVGHNIKTYDLRVIEDITQGVVSFDRTKVLDTLQLSKSLVKMEKHGLDYWGEILNIPKLDTPFSFYKFDQRMVPYCERDVDLNHKVFLALMELLAHKHGDKIPPRWAILNEFKEVSTSNPTLSEG